MLTAENMLNGILMASMEAAVLLIKDAESQVEMLVNLMNKQSARYCPVQWIVKSFLGTIGSITIFKHITHWIKGIVHPPQKDSVIYSPLMQ